MVTTHSTAFACMRTCFVSIIQLHINAWNLRHQSLLFSNIYSSKRTKSNGKSTTFYRFTTCLSHRYSLYKKNYKLYHQNNYYSCGFRCSLLGIKWFTHPLSRCLIKKITLRGIKHKYLTIFKEVKITISPFFRNFAINSVIRTFCSHNKEEQKKTDKERSNK